MKAALGHSAPMLADKDFLVVALAWETLPIAIKSGIVAMVKAVRDVEASNGEGEIRNDSNPQSTAATPFTS